MAYPKSRTFVGSETRNMRPRTLKLKPETCNLIHRWNWGPKTCDTYFTWDQSPRTQDTERGIWDTYDR